jgi:hypothetical protein
MQSVIDEPRSFPGSSACPGWLCLALSSQSAIAKVRRDEQPANKIVVAINANAWRRGLDATRMGFSLMDHPVREERSPIKLGQSDRFRAVAREWFLRRPHT